MQYWCVYVQYICVESGCVRTFTSCQLADPLMFGVTGLWRESVGQVTVHGTVPPVILVVLILYEGRHHLHHNTHTQGKLIMDEYQYCYNRSCGYLDILTGAPSDHSQDPRCSGSLLFKPTQNQRPSVLKKRRRTKTHCNKSPSEEVFYMEAVYLLSWR